MAWSVKYEYRPVWCWHKILWCLSCVRRYQLYRVLQFTVAKKQIQNLFLRQMEIHMFKRPLTSCNFIRFRDMHGWNAWNNQHDGQPSWGPFHSTPSCSPFWLNKTSFEKSQKQDDTQTPTQKQQGNPSREIHTTELLWRPTLTRSGKNDKKEAAHFHLEWL